MITLRPYRQHAADFTIILTGLAELRARAEEKEGRDPPPPGAEDRAALERQLMDVIFDLPKCRSVVEQGILSWDTVRAIQWLVTGRDAGETPKWDEWAAELISERQTSVPTVTNPPDASMSTAPGGERSSRPTVIDGPGIEQAESCDDLSCSACALSEGVTE